MLGEGGNGREELDTGRLQKDTEQEGEKRKGLREEMERGRRFFGEKGEREGQLGKQWRGKEMGKDDDRTVQGWDRGRDRDRERGKDWEDSEGEGMKGCTVVWRDGMKREKGNDVQAQKERLR